MPPLLAKSPRTKGAPTFGETLDGHTQQVVDGFHHLFGSDPDSPTRLARKWLTFFKLTPADFRPFFVNAQISCGCHDAGKANEGFAGVVSRRRGAVQILRHEHLSGMLLYLPTVAPLIDGIAEADCRIIFAAVAGHHLKSPPETFARPLNPDLKVVRLFPEAIARLIAAAIVRAGGSEPPDASIEIPEVWCFDGSGDFDPARLRERIRKQVMGRFKRELRSEVRLNRLLTSVRAALILADSAGSAITREDKDLASWLAAAFGDPLGETDIQAKVIDPRIEQVRRQRGDFQWIGFQTAAAELPPRALLLSPCGSGKTLAAWRWIAAQLNRQPAARVIFLYPTRATATEGFRDYVSWAPEADAALAHGTAAYDLDGMFDQPADERSGRDYATEDRLFALGYWHRRIFSATVDQFLGFMQHVYRSICLMPLLADSVVVFDEVHSFDPALFSALKQFLSHFDVPALCMTASLPPARRDDLVTDCGLTRFPTDADRFEDLAAKAEMSRYAVRRIDPESAESVALDALAEGRRVLWVVNTVARCQSLARRLGARCYHSRYTLHDRKARHGEVIRAFQGDDGGAVLAVTTQVCEMSLDLDADVLISEIGPITALIQRMGRCNRHARPGDGRLGEVFFYPPEDEMPYTPEDLTGADAFLNEIDGRTVSQQTLQTLLETHGAGAVEVEKYTAFLEAGPWASAREQNLRDIDEFTVNALLDGHLDEYFDRRRNRQPVDGLLVPVPRRFASQHPRIGRFPPVAPEIHYDPQYGFFDHPLEDIL
jgi:CRISPR-associated endonuclease/helicase Cas3